MQINFANYKPGLLVTTIGMLWAVSSWALSNLWGYGLLQGIGPSVIVMGTLVLYDKYLWKLPVMNWMNTIPNLNGIYEGNIFYHHNGQNSTKACKLQIKQTCSMIKVKTIFSKEEENDTHSVSTESFIKTDEAGDQHLYYYYRNEGSCQNGDTLNPHDGMNILEIRQSGEEIKLEGHYFTNRDPQTKGSMKVTKITKGDE